MGALKSPILLGLLLALSCGRKEQPVPAAASASASAEPSASAAPEAVAPPTSGGDVSFEAPDGVMLYGTYYDAGDAAPLLVFAHRFRGDRTDWAPLVERLGKSEKRYSMLNFDMRGHGASTAAPDGKPLSWSTMKPGDIPDLATDVHAAIRFGLDQSGGSAPAVVLAGSSLGAALASAAAREDARVVALALASPGAAIMGYDLYRRFAEVRMLSAFIACAKDDNVCRDPASALQSMGGAQATVKQYEGGGHGARALLTSSSEPSEDLESFLMAVYDERPKERHTRPPAFEQKKKRK